MYDDSMSQAFTFFSGIWLIVWLAVTIFFIVCIWKIFEKANYPGWAAIIPIYNTIVMLQIAQKPVWWIFLMLIPFVNVIIFILMYVDFAKNFGASTGFAVGLIFLPVIFFPILAFGDYDYIENR